MGKISSYKNAFERFISGESGQRFFNFAYSIGAAIVIWGALFKILHLPGGNVLLSIGMGTEVVMFILTAFDRPPRTYNWEEVFPVFDSHSEEDRPAMGGQPVVNGGGGVIVASPAVAGEQQPTAPVHHTVPSADAASATEQYVNQLDAVSTQLEKLQTTTESLNRIGEVLLQSYSAITANADNIAGSATGYAEQMQALSRNIAGLNTIYEIQLKSVSSQLDTIDRVNRGMKEIGAMYENTASQSARYCEETQRMACHLQQLNQIYAQMLQAMTMNMYSPMGGAATSVTPPPAPAEDSAV